MDSLIIGLITGVIGMAYFAYGKRAHRVAPMICGVLLGSFPMLVDNLYVLAIASIGLMATPFFTDF